MGLPEGGGTTNDVRHLPDVRREGAYPSDVDRSPNQVLEVRHELSRRRGAKAAAPAVAAATLAAVNPDRGDTIEVEGLDESVWTATSAVVPTEGSAYTAHDATGTTFTASPHEPDAPGQSAVKHYKLLTPKDKFFEGKFEIGRLEDALNHYAREGWVVRSMATPHVAGFSGVAKEELVVLLER